MKRVVVMDDNLLVREAICKTIDWNKIDCELIGEFGNGIEGFDFACKNYPDIIITDIKMPGMNGLDMIAALKREYSEFRTIVITGYNEFQFARQALRLGAIDIILKPIENKELIETILHATDDLNCLSAMPETENTNTEKKAMKYEYQFLNFLPSQEHYTSAVRNALEYIKNNLDRKISLNELADYAGFSSAHLSRLLKKKTGKSFMDVVIQMRIEVAITLLKEGKYKVYEVANMVGIDNYAYFYQLFKKNTGKSPKEYL